MCETKVPFRRSCEVRDSEAMDMRRQKRGMVATLTRSCEVGNEMRADEDVMMLDETKIKKWR